MSVPTCFRKPPQNRLSCPTTSETSSFRLGVGWVFAGGVAAPDISYVSKKFIAGLVRS